jgi:predicted Zn-dependent protease
MEGGDAASPEELVRGMKRGLWICRLHYVNGLVDTRRTVMTGLTRDGCFLVEDGKISRPVLNLRFTDSFLEALGRCDGMTRERATVLTWWSETGSTVVPAIRLRGFRFNAGSPRLSIE